MGGFLLVKNSLQAGIQLEVKLPWYKGITLKVIHIINLIQDENLTFQGHPGHPSDFADPGDRSRDHDPGHPVRLQLRVQAARPGEGDEQGKLLNLPNFERLGIVAKTS